MGHDFPTPPPPRSFSSSFAAQRAGQYNDDQAFAHVDRHKQSLTSPVLTLPVPDALVTLEFPALDGPFAPPLAIEGPPEPVLQITSGPDVAADIKTTSTAESLSIGPQIDDMSFIGDKVIFRGKEPPANPWNENETLAFFRKSMIGLYTGDWEGADAFPHPFKVIKHAVLGTVPKFEKAVIANMQVDVDHHSLKQPRCGMSGVQATWLGHATYLVQVAGLNILCDPVFSKRCAPVQFIGPKRFVDAPLKISELPRIDIVSVSHNHYDHLDLYSINELRKVHNPVFVVPKGMRTWFKTLGWKRTPEEKARGVKKLVNDRVIEFEWWKAQFVSVPSNPGLKICVTHVPGQHWSMRTGPWDKDRQLWGGWVFEVDVAQYINDPYAHAHEGPCVRRIYHAGDTAYCKVFRDIGNVFRRFDLAMIPIGAYHPRWYLKRQHVDPAQAVKIHIDLNRPTRSLAMHWGTFCLSDEPIDEPKKLLIETGRAAGLDRDEFIAPKHGQSVCVQAPPTQQRGPKPLNSTTPYGSSQAADPRG
jgi:N-acyl-phosphatidylethanolamine-hydrolysing phospholipase D